jgi:hypothetical protein
MTGRRVDITSRSHVGIAQRTLAGDMSRDDVTVEGSHE